MAALGTGSVASAPAGPASAGDGGSGRRLSGPPRAGSDQRAWLGGPGAGALHEASPRRASGAAERVRMPSFALRRPGLR